MNDYIAKPVQVAELKKTLGRVTENLGKGGDRLGCYRPKTLS
ncbi:hypothetical protein [Desulfomicrobium sp. ZS1]|nr:hypothetical protein [Desulfomicrobium sp. ZS1]